MKSSDHKPSHHHQSLENENDDSLENIQYKIDNLERALLGRVEDQPPMSMPFANQNIAERVRYSNGTKEAEQYEREVQNKNYENEDFEENEYQDAGYDDYNDYEDEEEELQHPQVYIDEYQREIDNHSQKIQKGQNPKKKYAKNSTKKKVAKTSQARYRQNEGYEDEEDRAINNLKSKISNYSQTILNKNGIASALQGALKQNYLKLNQEIELL